MLTVSLLLTSIPAIANTGNSMSSEQITVINGNNNYSNSTSNQSITNSSQGGNNSGVSMKNKQVCDIAGNNNSCVNSNEQRVDNNRRYRR
ncbi:hypothetical protein [Chamaesiphon polymorphus]|uniref:hypothetical protein n=1 Tax=Chamaesiphon polymorphus TaxID=2107691 RepID=UPI0011B26AA9|nr:hypothetical protein [Chamaesiphon polymorphus]